ncbi:MAG: hypothetical protein ACLR5T_01700 [Veillonella sp.]
MINEVALGRALRERRTYEISKIITYYGNCFLGVAGQVHAAQDPLMMPEQPTALDCRTTRNLSCCS